MNPDLNPIIRVGFTGGVKASFDPIAVPPTSLWRARNARLTESGCIRLRGGYSTFTTSLGAGSVQGVGAGFDGILVAWHRDLYLYDSLGAPTTLDTGHMGAATTSPVGIVHWTASGAEIAYLFSGAGIYSTGGSTTVLVTPYAPGVGEPVNLIRAGDGSQDIDTGPARCTIALLRPSTGQRIAATGDPDSPNTVYLCGAGGANDGGYWPVDQTIQLPDDGGRIVGLGLYMGVLVIYRDEDHDVWAWTGTDATDIDGRLVLQDQVGCVSGDTIVPVPGEGIIFLGKDNVYALKELSGVENQVRAVPIGDDIRTQLLEATAGGTTGASAVYYDREYKLSIPQATGPDCVFCYRPDQGWFIDGGPRTSRFVEYGGKLYAAAYGAGRLMEYNPKLLQDEGVYNPLYVEFGREKLLVRTAGDDLVGPVRVKRVYVIVPKKGRVPSSASLYFFSDRFNNFMFNEADSETVASVAGTEQHILATVSVDGFTYSTDNFHVVTGRSPVAAEPILLHQANIVPSLKGYFVQVRIDSEVADEDIAILGYGIAFEPRQDFKGYTGGVTP